MADGVAADVWLLISKAVTAGMPLDVFSVLISQWVSSSEGLGG